MREDMAKVIHERGKSRPYSGWGKRGRGTKYKKNQYGEEAPKSERLGSDRHRGGDTIISPIRGFLRKNVGRLYDNVFSEFCEHNDQRSKNGRDAVRHLKWLVEQDLCRDEEGRLYTQDWGRRNYLTDENNRSLVRSETFYVDEKGLLKRLAPVARKSYRKREYTSFFRPINKTQAHYKYMGNWYWIEVQKSVSEGLTPREIRIFNDEVRTRGKVSLTAQYLSDTYRRLPKEFEKTTIVNQRQLNHRDLVRFKLTNDLTPGTE